MVATESFEQLIPTLGRAGLRASVAEAIERMDSACASGACAGAVGAALATCRVLHRHARSAEALPLARAALEHATQMDDPALGRRAATACGLLAADTLDLVGAIEHHILALRYANGLGDPVDGSRVWNSIGLAMGISGHYELAARCYRRAIDLVAAVDGSVHPRYAALTNLGHCHFRAGTVEEGLPYALLALKEETPAFRADDPLNALFVRRNLVRLLVGCGRLEEARAYLAECGELAGQLSTPRAAIALATTLGTYEIAVGQTDVALTRLDKALAKAREVPAALHDTLITVIRAEEAAGNVERALVRVEELTEHVYRRAIESARGHVELSMLEPANAIESAQRQAQARLGALAPAPAVPGAWMPLDRLAVSAVLRMDATGWHGKRVGALVKGLAVTSGVPPLQSLEMGFAAELHDIGMLSVPDGILRKCDSLNAAERGIVGRHVEAGVEMLGDDRHPRVFVAREIARYHHARWDGEGHPAVAGKRIPLAARACAVADAYDAMVCGLGGGARSMEEALAELRAESGGQFDPELVECFEDLIHTESADLGVDPASNPGMKEFQSLVTALQEDRGFV
jgi:putative two-component system response regulator